ncbi:pyridoxal-phosphate-dependent aminotransferase family protein [Candidatus Omnitrophota bacterium]
MENNRLLTPGPTPLPREVLEAQARQIIHHRTPQFREVLKEVEEGLKYLYQTKNDVLILTSSGTGAMEAAVCNLLSPQDTAICVEGGKFGERWTELCASYGVRPEVIKVAWGEAVDPAEIEKRLKANPKIKAVFTTHCETSTGVTADIEKIGQVVGKSEAVLVVDAISGLGAIPLLSDAWGCDVVVCGSQKGLMLPPGLAFISLSDKAQKLIESSKSPKYYFDLKKAKKSCEKSDTPYTPAISLIIALQESLKLLRGEGLEKLFSRFTRMAKAARAAIDALGLELLAPDAASDAVTAVKVPQGLDGAKLVKTMRDEKGVSIAGGQGELKGNIFRIAHMGYIKEDDLIYGISMLEDTLQEMGYKFDHGAGVKAAKAILK